MRRRDRLGTKSEKIDRSKLSTRCSDRRYASLDVNIPEGLHINPMSARTKYRPVRWLLKQNERRVLGTFQPCEERCEHSYRPYWYLDPTPYIGMVRTTKPDEQAIAEGEHKQLIKPIQSSFHYKQEERPAKLTGDLQEL